MGIIEDKVEKGFLTYNGCEAESNNGTVRIVLRKMSIMVPENNLISHFYTTTSFFKEGSAWIKSETEQCIYKSVNEFASALSGIPDFSEASVNIFKQLKTK